MLILKIRFSLAVITASAYIHMTRQKPAELTLSLATDPAEFTTEMMNN